MQAALLAGLPQAPSLYDPILYPEAALAPPRRGAEGAVRQRRHLVRPLPGCARATTSLHLKPGRLYSQIREPYFFSYVRDQLIADVRRRRPSSRAACACTRRSTRRSSARRSKAITDTLYLKDDPAAALVSINPANGAIRAMTSVYPGPDEEPVQPRRAGAAAGRLDLQDVRAHPGGRRTG